MTKDQPTAQKFVADSLLPELNAGWRTKALETGKIQPGATPTSTPPPATLASIEYRLNYLLRLFAGNPDQADTLSGYKPMKCSRSSSPDCRDNHFYNV